MSFVVKVTDASGASCEKTFSIDLAVTTGLRVENNTPGMVGITDLTVKHTSNRYGYTFNDCDNLLSLKFPNLTILPDSFGSVFIESNNVLAVLQFPLLTRVGGTFQITNNPLLGILQAPKLVTLDNDILLNDTGAPTLAVSFPLLKTIGGAFLGINSSMGSISLPALTSIALALELNTTTNLKSISMPLLQTVGNYIIIDGVDIETIYVPTLSTVGAYFNINNVTSLEFLTLTSLVSCFSFFLDQNLLSAVNLPALTTVTDDFQIRGSLLEEINVPSLASCDLFQLENCEALNDFQCPSLASCPGSIILFNVGLTGSVTFSDFFPLITSTFDIIFRAMNGPTSVDMTGIAFQSVKVRDCTALTTLACPGLFPANGQSQTAINCALTLASVDGLLNLCIANPAYVSGTVDISGGTNAAPTPALVTTLTGRGVTVLHN